jgi:hypothetical protein
LRARAAVKGRSRATTAAPHVWACSKLPSLDPESTYTIRSAWPVRDRRQVFSRSPSLRPMTTIPAAPSVRGGSAVLGAWGESGGKAKARHSYHAGGPGVVRTFLGWFAAGLPVLAAQAGGVRTRWRRCATWRSACCAWRAWRTSRPRPAISVGMSSVLEPQARAKPPSAEGHGVVRLHLPH